MTDDRRVTQRSAVAAGKPQIAGHGRSGKDQRANRHSSCYIEESRIAAFMRRHVVRRKTDRVGSAMVVNGEVRQPPVPRTENPALDELRLQHSIAALPRHVVHTVLRQMDLPRDEPQTTVGLARASKDHGTVLVAIPGKQVPLELSVQPPRDRHPPGLHAGLFIPFCGTRGDTRQSGRYAAPTAAQAPSGHPSAGGQRSRLGVVAGPGTWHSGCVTGTPRCRWR